MPSGVISSARHDFHVALRSRLLTRDTEGIPSNADKKNKGSVTIANGIIDRLGGCKTARKLAGQTAGAEFEEKCAEFVKECFGALEHMRPGEWFVGRGQGPDNLDISNYDQYSHLAALATLAKDSVPLATALGNDYLIKPDVVVTRSPEPDESFNATDLVVDSDSATYTSLRKVNQERRILHASISCKWTMRSDRAQNSRSEGLNLVRNRKGRLPHISVITAEPTPSRIASIAMGTGDIDCVYHFALYELLDTVAADENLSDSLDLLNVMIDGKRLRDVSDLPIDLIV